MSREIEFKGKDKETKEWVYGSFFNTSPIYTIIENHGENTSDFHFIQNETLGEYTGVKDADKTKLYTKDIVMLDDFMGNEPYKAICEYSENEALFVFQSIEDETKTCAVLDYLMETSTKNPESYFRIIGNVADNPELLEV